MLFRALALADNHVCNILTAGEERIRMINVARVNDLVEMEDSNIDRFVRRDEQLVDLYDRRNY